MKLLLLFIACFFTLTGLSAQIKEPTYYIDSWKGNDKNIGTNPSQAWRSLDRINSENYGPGTKILLVSGGYWRGQLAPKGSGTTGKPIVVSSYGEGYLPIIDGGGMEGEGVVFLKNQSFWEISNLQIINDAPQEGDRRGLEIRATNYGLAQHYHLKNLTINNIRGIPGNEMHSKKTAGIYIAVESDIQKPTRFDDILIEDCLIYNVDNQGLALSNEITVNDYPGTPEWEQRKFTNVHIRNNIIHHISKSAMIIRLTENGVVEHNLCYETALKTTGNTIYSRGAKGTVFQFNEGFLNRSPDYDGSFYDPDLNSPATKWQWSLSHHNAHGLVWFCTTKNDSAVIVRNNISFNDKGALVYFNYQFAHAEVSGNRFYIGTNYQPVIIRENPKNYHKYKYFDNTVFNKSGSGTFLFSLQDTPLQVRQFNGNKWIGKTSAVLPKGIFDVSPQPYQEAMLQYFTGFPTPQRSKDNAQLQVSPAELQREMQRYRPIILSLYASKEGYSNEKLQLIDTKGSEINEALRIKALQILDETEVIQQMMVKKNIPFETDYSKLVNGIKAFNSNRKAVMSQGKIVYGPALFREQEYFDYLYANAVINLKEAMFDNDISVTPDVLQLYYSRVKPAKDWKRYTKLEEHYLRVKEEYYEEQFKNLVNEELNKKVVNSRKGVSSALNQPIIEKADRTISPEAFLSTRFENTNIIEGFEFGIVNDYKGVSTRLLLDIYEPAGDNSVGRPAIIWIHGGGFRSGSSRTQNYVVNYCKDFARRGYVCVSIDYRLRNGKDMPDKASEFPALTDATADAYTALEWIRANASKFRIDTNHIFLAGGSAGGRIAISLSCYDNITDGKQSEQKPWNKKGLIATASLWGGPEQELRGWVYPHLNKAIPILLIHGDADKTIPVQNSIDLFEALKKTGISTEIHIIPGAPHTPTGPAYDRMIVDWIARFFVNEWQK